MLRESLAADLATHMRLHAPAAPAFRLQDGKGPKMLKSDLELAGIPYIDESGRYGDFHALRHTFITNLVRAGVHPRVAQELAPHSDVNLTMTHYTHVLVETRLEALGKLPEIMVDVPENESAAKTGTDDMLASDDTKIIVMPVDSFTPDSGAKIRTYGDNAKLENRHASEPLEHKKALSHKGKQGIQYLAPRKGTRNPYLQLRRLSQKTYNPLSFQMAAEILKRRCHADCQSRPQRRAIQPKMS